MDSVDSYKAIPVSLGKVVSAGGAEIRPAKDLGALSAYWSLCSRYSRYEVYLGDQLEEPLLITKSGNKVVGTVVRGGKGTFVLLPAIKFPSEEFLKKDKKGGAYWTTPAMRFGKQLAACFVETDRALQNTKEETPAPAWAKDSEYRFEQEANLEKRIEALNSSLQELQEKRASLSVALEKAGSLRKLLYEKGKPLEHAILEALSLLDFKAEPFQDAESDFDAVFIASEGRFLGEAEGKDNKPINIEKLDQLERNIREDFGRKGVKEYAKGVLFGNAYRLMPLDGRKGFFTAKCLSGAKRSKVALIRTSDLFEVAKYLKSNKDAAFAKACRAAIVRAQGEIVVFPQVPGGDDKGRAEIREAKTSNKTPEEI